MADLNNDQFKAVVADEAGEMDRVFSTKTHVRGLVSVENIKEGDLFRHTWQHEYPFQRATGAAIYDPHHPDTGTWRYYAVPIPRSFAPHMPEGMKLKVIRERKKPLG